MWRFCFLTAAACLALSGLNVIAQWLVLLWALLTADGDLMMGGLMRTAGAMLLFGALTWVAAAILENEPTDRR